MIYCVILGAVSQVYNSTYPLDFGGQTGKCAFDGLDHLQKWWAGAWVRFMMGQTSCNFLGINSNLLYFISSRVSLELSLLTNKSHAHKAGHVPGLTERIGAL